MDVIAGTGNTRSFKFVFLPNLSTVKASTVFRIKMAINNPGRDTLSTRGRISTPRHAVAGQFAGHDHQPHPWHFVDPCPSRCRATLHRSAQFPMSVVWHASPSVLFHPSPNPYCALRSLPSLSAHTVS
ncbi:hypothetical protein BC827DRAFT_1245916 [Russula dissimulans]|nr:hypothetical protein BC827DRAFT_1245916 [Russula dissimulans]